MEWSIRGLLNPVITRLLIYGVNPIDVEYVLSKVESKNHLNSKSLEKSWLEEWEKKADKYTSLGVEAEKRSSSISAKEYFFYASQCWYALFLINFSSIEEKKRVYKNYSDLYKRSMSHSTSNVEYVEIPIEGNQTLSAYLHHPQKDDGSLKNCVIIYSGLGSCKEEMNTLARPLVDRGFAVLTPDMPGNGQTLFEKGVKCRVKTLESAFTKIPDYLESRTDIKKSAFGVYGLCMGGGYAYRAASIDKRYVGCVNFFPLFISMIDQKTTPQWMKQGDWYSYQVGENIPGQEFIEEMKALEAGNLSCPYLFVHGNHDNWMTIDLAMTLYERASGLKEKIIVEEEPVFSNQQFVTHTMPVGEQLHWIRYEAADWMKRCIMND